MSERTHFKLKSSIEGGHIVERLFAGREGYTLECAGELRWSIRDEVGQWQLFGAALLLANDKMEGHALFECEGGEEVVEALARLDRVVEKGETG